MSVSSELQNYIQSAFPNLPGVICISITDRDGAVVLEVQRGSATSPLATRHMYAAAGLVTDNGNVGLGDVLMLTAEAENGTVVHLPLKHLVISFFCESGNAPIGAIRDLRPDLALTLQGLNAQIGAIVDDGN
eukprot:m.171867 g.171867  ORF g.171867 m.171867 type:complete len:132 (-) comp14564_c0_seq8:1611-2006(-)